MAVLFICSFVKRGENAREDCLGKPAKMGSPCGLGLASYRAHAQQRMSCLWAGRFTCALPLSSLSGCKTRWHMCLRVQGNGFFGQLGGGTAESSSVPVQVTGNHTFTSLTASAQRLTACSSIALLARLRVWPQADHVPANSAPPQAGDQHTCGVESGTNNAFCWWV